MVGRSGAMPGRVVAAETSPISLPTKMADTTVEAGENIIGMLIDIDMHQQF